jgi:hypothetical protein
MVPFIVLIALFVLLSTLGHYHILVADGWWTSLRLALSGMFLLTASAHWGKRRPDLIRIHQFSLGPIFSSQRPELSR